MSLSDRLRSAMCLHRTCCVDDHCSKCGGPFDGARPWPRFLCSPTDRNHKRCNTEDPAPHCWRCGAALSDYEDDPDGGHGFKDGDEPDQGVW